MGTCSLQGREGEQEILPDPMCYDQCTNNIPGGGQRYLLCIEMKCFCRSMGQGPPGLQQSGVPLNAGGVSTPEQVPPQPPADIGANISATPSENPPNSAGNYQGSISLAPLPQPGAASDPSMGNTPNLPPAGGSVAGSGQSNAAGPGQNNPAGHESSTSEATVESTGASNATQSNTTGSAQPSPASRM